MRATAINGKDRATCSGRGRSVALGVGSLEVLADEVVDLLLAGVWRTDKSANVAMRPLLPSRWDWMQPRHDRQDLAAFVPTATSRHEAHIDRSIRMRSRVELGGRVQGNTRLWLVRTS